MPTNKSKTILSPLIISKSLIQSVPNKSPNQFSNSESNDGWITPTPEKRQHASPFTPNSRQQNKYQQKYLSLEIDFPYFWI